MADVSEAMAPAPMTPGRALELQARYAASRRAHRERLGLGHGSGDRNSGPVKGG